jgi:hypothetical protein
MKGIIHRSTSFLRVMPNYLIIGAQKAGTSSLFNYLSMHPQVVNSSRKEIHYFDKNIDKPLSWYKQYFPLRFNISNHYAVGEASPNYLFHPYVAQRIHNILPKVKLIVVLRNPVDRVISQYFQAVRKNNEQRSIMQALSEEDAEELIIMNELAKNEFFTPENVHLLYKSRSRYAEQLERFFKLFTKEQILILSSKELLNMPNETLKKVYDFLRINNDFYLREVTHWNVGTNKKEIPKEVILYLTDYFKPYNDNLFNLLGYEIYW